MVPLAKRPTARPFAITCALLSLLASGALAAPSSDASSTSSGTAAAVATGPSLRIDSPLQLSVRLVSPQLPLLPSGQPRQGPKDFGASVAISGDGSTAVIGAPANGAWAYTRSGGVWTQGQQLTTIGGDVALSSDGNTAIVGNPCEHGQESALVLTRSGGMWTQQGAALSPDDAQRGGECSRFGSVVALSANGGTALIGDPSDAEHQGAAWVFTRSGTGWTQQGPRLRPSDEIGAGSFGGTVALSADGSIALIGGPQDGSESAHPQRSLQQVEPGAAWVFTRSGTTWFQRQKLKPTDEVLGERGRGAFGSAVALSADGATAIVGAENDNDQGAAWAFTRSGTTWLQQGPKLIGSHEGSGFGGAVGLSGDGSSVLIAAVPSAFSYGSSYQGEGWQRGGHGTVWPFARVGSTWIREPSTEGPNPKWATEEFAYGLTLSASGNTALIGAPDGFDDPGAAWAATLAPLPANSFSTGRITIRPNAILDQQLSSSAAGTFFARATVNSRALGPPSARERRELRRCHPRRKRPTRACPRGEPVIYGSARIQVAGAGTSSISVLPGPRVRRALESYHELKVTLAMSFQPNAGPAPPAQSRTIVVELGRRESY